MWGIFALAYFFFLAAPPLFSLQTECAGCHREIYERFRLGGMGRSFYRPTPQNTVEDYSRRNTFYHEASDEHYTMYARGGRYYQRRHQIGADGQEINVVEMSADFVLGSGNHVRSYAHQMPDGQLLELPVAWYAERGGFWGMNPGYDRPDHLDFRRKIDRECLFCHNAYPNRGDPEGIDCQRCHGPGRAHTEAARSGSVENIRRSIVNPARLSRERQLEVCLQCHLESTSRSLPYSLRRYGREYFSYLPGAPLEDYILHFDRARGSGFGDSFEIAHAAYRLLQSACFRKSGTLTCVTCHDPHGPSSGEEAARRYAQVCRGCHADSHAPAGSCVECHMPRRRADDVVHVVMTDHWIQRRPPSRDLLAPLREVHDNPRTAYRGEVVLLYPQRLAPTAANELYLAAAQVVDGANLTAGIARLEKALKATRQAPAEFYFDLANAYGKTNQNERAVASYEEALRRKPALAEVRRNYALALGRLDRWPAAIKVLETAVAAAPDDPAGLNQLGEALLHVGQTDRAVATLRRALRADPDLPEAYVNLGAALVRTGDRSGAVDAFRGAILWSPNLAAAHGNLAGILAAEKDFAPAEDHFRRAIRADPDSAATHYNYGRALSGRGRLEEAEAELRAALRIDPRFAEAATALGVALGRRGEARAAIEQYRAALRIKPDLAAAHFNLGLALFELRERAAAKPHFEAVLRADPADFQAHLYLGKILLAGGQKGAAIAHLRKAAESPRADVRAAAKEALR